MGQLGAKLKYKDITIAAPADTVLASNTIAGATEIISATCLYTDGFYFIRPVVSSAKNTVHIRYNTYASAQTIVVRVVYI